MKVLHIGLASHFTDKMLYQDNILAELNAKAGHDVTFISDVFYYHNGSLEESNECDLMLDNGVRLIRIKYDRIINGFITNKIQKAKKLVNYLNEIKPDTILYHGVCGYELMDVSKYVKEHGILFYIDSHEDFYNTARTPIAKFAYKYIHGVFIKRALPIAKKVFYISNPTKEYLQEMYHISEKNLEFFPLGGIPMSNERHVECRKKIVNELGIHEDAIICSHSGKMDRGKKTEEILNALSKISDERLRLLIFGSIPKDMKTILEPLINQDPRVYYLGWKNAEEQRELLGATDLYLQPGTGSATAQIAMCCGCALLVNRNYRTDMEDAVFYEEDEQGIINVLQSVLADEELLKEMKKKSYAMADRKFDYGKLAQRYLS